MWLSDAEFLKRLSISLFANNRPHTDKWRDMTSTLGILHPPPHILFYFQKNA
jgi:hypothetical protein